MSLVINNWNRIEIDTFEVRQLFLQTYDRNTNIVHQKYSQAFLKCNAQLNNGSLNVKSTAGMNKNHVFHLLTISL